MHNVGRIAITNHKRRSKLRQSVMFAAQGHNCTHHHQIRPSRYNRTSIPCRATKSSSNAVSVPFSTYRFRLSTGSFLHFCVSAVLFATSISSRCLTQILFHRCGTMSITNFPVARFALCSDSSKNSVFLLSLSNSILFF